MAELADALDSGSSDFTVIQVQVLLPAPSKSLENTEFSRLFNVFILFCRNIATHQIFYFFFIFS